MEQEIWRDIEGYDGLYMVSNLRRVKSLNYNKSGKERALKLQKDKDGYLFVQLSKCGEHKNCWIHRLVAQAFILNPENCPEINHIDEDKTNNTVGNLEWCDRKYNCNYGTRNEKISRPVRCVETNTIYSSTRDAQRKTGIFASSISGCANHKKGFFTARRLHWQYI